MNVTVTEQKKCISLISTLYQLGEIDSETKAELVQLVTKKRLKDFKDYVSTNHRRYYEMFFNN